MVQSLIHFTCRSFFLHVPIVFLCAIVALLQVPKDAPQDPQSALLDDNQERPEEKTSGPENMDILGMILLVCAVVSALMMVQVLQGTIVPESKLYISIGLGTASLLLVGFFCVHEIHWAKRPLIPLSFMMSSQTGIACTVQIFLMVADLAVSYTRSFPSH